MNSLRLCSRLCPRAGAGPARSTGWLLKSGAAERAFVAARYQHGRNASSKSTPSKDYVSPTDAWAKGSATDNRSIHDIMSLKGRVTVVTGAGRGIGLTLARGMAELGSDIAILDTLEKPLMDISSLEDQFGVKFKYYRTDVTDSQKLEDTFASVVQDFGQINNCITAAGIVLDKPFLEHGWEESSRILNVNVMGTFHSVQLAAKQMQQQNTGGSIVMIASVASHVAIPSQRLAIYGASKGAVRILSHHLAVELAPLGIRVNTISPGYIATEMTKSLGAKYPELLRVFESAPPLGRIGRMEDLKVAVGYLLSDAAAYTTGTDIQVTGGLHAGRI